MDLLILLFFIALAFIVGKIWIWLVNSVMNPLIQKAEKKENKPNIDNPYIAEHLARRYNDRSYEEYLDWLDKDGGDLPVKKILTQEEWEFEQQLKKEKL